MDDTAPRRLLAEPDVETQRRQAAADWRAEFDPDHRVDPKVIAEAASRATLFDRGGRVGFEPLSFADLVTFIAELPF